MPETQRLPPHPLLPPALALVAGILAAHYGPALPAWPFLAGAALGGTALLAWGLARGRLPVVLVSLSALLLGAGLYAVHRDQVLPSHHLRHLVSRQPRLVVLDVLTAAEPTSRGWRVTARAVSVDRRPAVGRLRLSGPRAVAPPGVGRRLRARLRLRPVVSFANPGGFDYARHLAHQGVHVRAYAGKTSGLTDLGPGRLGWLARRVEGARARLGRLLQRLPPGSGRALLRALILGQRGELKGRVRRAFAETGTAHLLAISGLHLGLVWGAAFLVLRLALGLWPAVALRLTALKPAAALALLPCAGYALLAGASTPTLRALVMAACLVAALVLARPYRPSGGLALAAIVICILWPWAPLSLSFQLSFTAVAAILLAAGPLTRRLQDWTGTRRWLGWTLGWLGVSALIGLAVWPLAVGHFHQLPLFMVPANAALVPLVGVFTLPLALLGAGLALAWPAAGLALWHLALIPADAAVEVARTLAALPGAVYYLAGPGPAAVAAIYAAALTLLSVPRPWRRPAAAGLALLAALLWLAGGRPPAPDTSLTAWVLDVGQGSSTVVRLPRGQVLVVDGGGWPGSDFDFGQRVVGPFLWSMGFSRLKVVAASHRHPDHAGGIPFLVRWFSPGQVWVNQTRNPKGLLARIVDLARAQGIPVRGPADLPREMTLGGARIRLVWPPREGLPRRWRENQRGLWLGFGLGRAWLWLPADNGPRVERRVAPTLPAGGFHALLAPHHGGKGSCTRPLLERLRPRIVLFSCACAGRYLMPRPEVLARVKATGAATFSTARWGCLRLSSRGGPWRVQPYLSRPRACP